LSGEQNIAKVTVLGMGGTIAMTRTPAGGVEPALSAADLVAAVPGLSEVPADIEVIDVRRLPGASLTFDDVREVYDAAASAYAAGADGAVVTQGTDSIEETAYLLDLWHGGPQPLVVTGAMRNPAQAGHDGPANLLAAIGTALAPQARDRGVMVVLADQIHAAARVRKTHATSLCAFTSPNGGPLGQLIEGRPWFAAPPGGRLTVPLPPPDARDKVGLMLVCLGDQGELLHGIGDGLNGLVVAGMGVGHVPAPLAPVLQDIAGKIPVVLATRTGAGPVLTATYAFPGSERDLRDRGLIPAGLLDPLKARILLLACLRAGASRADIAASFAVAGGYTDPAGWPWPAAARLLPRSEHPGCLHDAEAALRQHLDPAVRGGLEHQLIDARLLVQLLQRMCLADELLRRPGDADGVEHVVGDVFRYPPPVDRRDAVAELGLQRGRHAFPSGALERPRIAGCREIKGQHDRGTLPCECPVGMNRCDPPHRKRRAPGPASGPALGSALYRGQRHVLQVRLDAGQRVQRYPVAVRGRVLKHDPVQARAVDRQAQSPLARALVVQQGSGRGEEAAAELKSVLGRKRRLQQVHVFAEPWRRVVLDDPVAPPDASCAGTDPEGEPPVERLLHVGRRGGHVQRRPDEGVRDPGPDQHRRGDRTRGEGADDGV